MPFRRIRKNRIKQHRNIKHNPKKHDTQYITLLFPVSSKCTFSSWHDQMFCPASQTETYVKASRKNIMSEVDVLCHAWLRKNNDRLPHRVTPAIWKYYTRKLSFNNYSDDFMKIIHEKTAHIRKTHFPDDTRLFKRRMILSPFGKYTTLNVFPMPAEQSYA